MNKKRLKAPIEEASESACFVVCFFFLPFRTLPYETFDLSWCLSASWDFCYDATKPDIANVYLGCWYTWTRITVCWRFELGWISNQNAECYLLYFGGFLRGLDKIIFVCGATYRTVHGNRPTLCNSRAEFRMSDWDIFLFPEVFFFFL